MRQCFTVPTYCTYVGFLLEPAKRQPAQSAALLSSHAGRAAAEARALRGAVVGFASQTANPRAHHPRSPPDAHHAVGLPGPTRPRRSLVDQARRPGGR